MTPEIHIGDCLDVLAELPAGSVQCCVTSPRKSNGQFIKGTHWRPRRRHWDKDWLTEQYVALGRSTGDIARECECTDENILHWLRKHGIPRRNVSEARALKYWGLVGEANGMHGRTGASNPRYVDGSAPERQRLYVQGTGRAFLRAVLARDNYCCVRCYAGSTGSKSLHVHHLTPWAGNKSLRFCMDNVVTLCRECHNWVHSKKNVDVEFIR